jgi:integrase
MWLPSTTAVVQSISAAAFRRRSSSRCSEPNTPAACHSLSRRCAVAGEQPSSRGRCCHAIPVNSTNTIAPNTPGHPRAGARRADRAHAPVQGTIAAAAALYRHAVSRGLLNANPTRQLELPAPKGRRDRVAGPDEAAALLAALPAADRALWATAMYAGLRRGELRALRVSDLRLEEGVISVAYGWDDRVGRVSTKGANQRRVPIAAALRSLLAAELLRSGRRDDELLFGSGPGLPFQHSHLTRHADSACEAAGLARIPLHECPTYMGHSSIQITFDRYGHLMPGNEGEAAGLLDAYLGGAAAG